MSEEEARAIAQQAIGDQKIGTFLDFSSFYACFHYDPEAADVISAGAGALFVHKETGKTYQTGSYQPAAAFSDAYEACGDLLATLSSTVELRGVTEAFDRKKAVIQVKDELSRSLEEARDLIDQVLTDTAIRIECRSAWDALDTVEKFHGM